MAFEFAFKLKFSSKFECEFKFVLKFISKFSLNFEFSFALLPKIWELAKSKFPRTQSKNKRFGTLYLLSLPVVFTTGTTKFGLLYFHIAPDQGSVVVVP